MIGQKKLRIDSPHIKIEVVRVQCIESLLETGLGVGLVRVPQLARDEDIFARDATILDALADFVLVSVDSAKLSVIWGRVSAGHVAYRAASMCR